jgi:hypothetical protein
MAIKCSNGGTAHTHESVDEVRRCWGAQTEADNPAAIMDNLTGVKTQINPPSTKQVSYAMALLDTKVWPDSFTEEDLKGMERRQVSDLIDRLVKAPRKNLDKGASGPKPVQFEIPDGRYALEYAEGWKFFQVKQGHTRTFLELLIGSPGAYRHQKLYGVAANTVLEVIQKDPRQASINFGLESKTCGVCSSPLTNPESIAYGIGPKCRAKKGW